MKKIFLLILVAAFVGGGYFMYNKKFGDHRQVLDYPEGMTNTDGMLAVLKEKQARFQSPDNFYANTAQYDRLMEQEPPKDVDKRMKWYYKTAEQALNKGDTRRSIEICQEALEDIKATEYSGKFKLKIQDHLGISFFRLGEQENCLVNHNAESCILPFTPAAQHRMKEGSTSAIGVYTEILAEHPENHHARYMLNLAHMTLGTYPEGVPAEHLIPEDNFKSDYELPRFKNIAGELGMDCFSTSGSANIDDFNNDGWLDVFTCGFGLTEKLRYFENNGDGTFTEKTDATGLKGLPGGLNTVHCDFNNDGWTDLFVLRGGWWSKYGDVPNSLLRNNGDGTWTDVTKEAGLLSFHPTQSAVWADFDNDGFVDVFIGNETSRKSRHNPTELYHNNGDGTFTNVTKTAGAQYKGYIKGVASGDYDNDGLADIYISLYRSENILLRNTSEKGKLSFENTTEAAGVGKPKSSFPTWFFDYDNDGWLDIAVISFDMAARDQIEAEYSGKDFTAEFTKIYRNNGDGTFSNAADELGMETMLLAMGSNYGDIDNDGYLDFYIGTGKPDLRALYPNRMFRNNSGKGFQDVTTAGGFGHLQKGHAIAFGDLDNDGDQDVYAQMGGAFEDDFFQNALFENPGFGNSYLTVRVKGKTSNSSGIGCRITATVSNEEGRTWTIHRQISTGGSFGASSLQQEIGLGDATQVDELAIQWPTTGETQTFSNLEVNRIVTVTEGNATPEVEAPTPVKLGQPIENELFNEIDELATSSLSMELK